jgi:Tol biopolymer transport system component
MVAHFVDPDAGQVVRAHPQPDPKLELFCGGSWSPDGDRISCEGFGVDDPSLSGIYTIRTSDGGGLRRITSNPDGFDAPGDFSPDGERLVFTRFVDDEPVGAPDGSMIVFTRSSWTTPVSSSPLYIVNRDGTGLLQVTDGDADDNPDRGTPKGS